jgi:hypothetical protein
MAEASNSDGWLQSDVESTDAASQKPSVAQQPTPKLGFRKRRIGHIALYGVIPGVVTSVIAGVVMLLISGWFQPTPSKEDVNKYKNTEVRFRSVRHVLDFSKRVIVDKDDLKKKVSPVTWQRFLTVEKVGEVPTLYIQYGTSTLPLDIETNPQKSEIHEGRLSGRGVDNPAHAYTVHVDIADEKSGRPFDVVNEATFWNAFQPGNTNASFFVEQNTDRLVIHLRTQGTKFVRPRFSIRKFGEGQKAQEFKGAEARLTGQGKAVLWMVDSPLRDHLYQIEWEFEGDPPTPSS